MLFFIVAAPIYIPQTSAQVFLFSTSSSTLVITYVFDDSRDVITRYGFD